MSHERAPDPIREPELDRPGSAKGTNPLPDQSLSGRPAPVPQLASGNENPIWTVPLVLALVAVIALGLLFAFGLVVIGTPVGLAITGTLILVVGMMWRLVPNPPGAKAGDHERFILKLLRALQALFGGGVQ